MKIDREDMLELTRRMTPKRNCFGRIAGCYMDREGYLDGTFNANFLNLPLKDKEKNLAIAKTIPFSETNVNLKGYRFQKDKMGKNSMWKLLMGMKASRLKNDALMEIFYEMLSGTYQTKQEYAAFVFYGCYDVPVKASDKERMEDSEEVYDFIICAFCPLVEEYEPGEPECGFLFPAFTERSSDIYHVAVYQADAEQPHKELLEILGCE